MVSTFWTVEEITPIREFPRQTAFVANDECVVGVTIFQRGRLRCHSDLPEFGGYRVFVDRLVFPDFELARRGLFRESCNLQL
jgi:hypothetical protein